MPTGAEARCDDEPPSVGAMGTPVGMVRVGVADRQSVPLVADHQRDGPLEGGDLTLPDALDRCVAPVEARKLQLEDGSRILVRWNRGTLLKPVEVFVPQRSEIVLDGITISG